MRIYAGIKKTSGYGSLFFEITVYGRGIGKP